MKYANYAKKSEADQHSNCCDIVEIKLQKKTNEKLKTGNWGKKMILNFLKVIFKLFKLT
jgi:hypothetical protein